MYRIYEISDDGFLKIPCRYAYGHREDLFEDSYDSEAQARAAIRDCSETGEWVILSVASNWRRSSDAS